ncbi:MAG: long-chain fatty acid--CoA ligase [Deltaproteobacteria bacterium]|nr:long-chain fatty acid--CoA ligase [Deltaproteobacteria bacterium]
MLLTQSTTKRPDTIALICEGLSVTWHELDLRFNQVANAFIDLGIRAGDKVGILADMSIEYVEVFLGALRAGACVVPLPTGFTAPALAKIIQDSDLKILVISHSTKDTLFNLTKHINNPNLTHCINLDFRDFKQLSYGDLLQGQSGKSPHIDIDPNFDFDIIYSSGTTQSPKGILHSHRMRSFQIKRMGRLGLGEMSKTLIATPLYSNTTLVALLPTLAYGGTAILMPKFDAIRFLELSEQHRVTHTMLVPIQYQRLLRVPDFHTFDLWTYKNKFATGAPMSVAAKKELTSRWPGNFVEIYGQTEGGCTSLLDTSAHPEKLASVGRPASGVEVHILDEHDNPLPRGETGEIVGRAESMMTGYYRRPDLTDRITWRDKIGAVFYRTGDLGFIDEDGFLFLCGRKKDVIISGGFNIHATDLEQALLEHPIVVDAAVIGVPSEKWGETPLGIVVLEEECAISAEDLTTWVNDRVSKTHRLSGIKILKALPRNAAGKIQKRELRQAYSRPSDTETK